MFWKVARVLSIVTLVPAIIVFIYHYMRKVILTDNRKEEINDAKIIVEETLHEAKEIPEVDQKSIKRAKEKISKFVKEGKNDSST
jgi:ABC-type multidrug transport system ATPase subunit